MAAEHPNLSIVERTMGQRMQFLGLRPQLVEGGVKTGLDGLGISRVLAQFLEPSQPKAQGKFYVALEFKADVDHPAAGKADIRDLITVRGDALERSLELCANTYMDVSFPPLHSLFLGKAATGAEEMQLSSFVPAYGKAIRWQLYAGQLQVLNDSAGQLKNRLSDQPPLTLVLNTLTGYLAEPKLHWCKLYLRNATRGLICGCSIDGMKVPAASRRCRKSF